MENKQVKAKEKKEMESGVAFNPLRSEKIYVRFVPQKNTIAGNDPKHVGFGGMMDGAKHTFCVPTLRSTGHYKNILTNDEKEFLEKALGLDYNALSVYKTENNYWDNYHFDVTKEGLSLDLSNPEDYIKYKVLLAWTDIVAPSVKERIDRPQTTYRFELVQESEEDRIESLKMDSVMACYKEFGKIESDFDTMRVLVELMDARPYDAASKPDFFRARINSLIQADPKRFLNYVTDPLLHTKVILRRAHELGKVSKRGDYYYLKADNSPLCDTGEDPTLSIAARYLNQPSHQDIKFMLESEVEKAR